MSGWLETYRGTVSRWEVDHNDHLTVAYYFARIADAGLGALEAIGLGADYAAHERRACVTVDCYARYSRELRVGERTRDRGVRDDARLPARSASRFLDVRVPAGARRPARAGRPRPRPLGAAPPRDLLDAPPPRDDQRAER